MLLLSGDMLSSSRWRTRITRLDVTVPEPVVQVVTTGLSITRANLNPNVQVLNGISAQDVLDRCAKTIASTALQDQHSWVDPTIAEPTLM